MKRRIAAMVLVAGIFACAGCGESHESLAEESVSTMQEMVTTLEKVKDEASAKAAKPRLEELAKHLEDLGRRQEQLGAPSEAEIQAMDDKHGKRMEELSQKFVGEMMRLAFDPKIQPVLGDLDLKAVK